MIAISIIKGTNKKLNPCTADVVPEPTSKRTVTNKTSKSTHIIFR